jgi:hypothetical protein
MDKIFEEMMGNYIDRYLNSDNGQKLILLSMCNVLNQNNLDEAGKLLNEVLFFKKELKELKRISSKIKTALNSNSLSVGEAHMKLCFAVTETSKLLSLIKTQPKLIPDFDNRVDIIYKVLLPFNIHKGITLEEFLEMDENDYEDPEVYSEAPKSYTGPYDPPERNEESRLMKYGYSVGQNSRFTDAERQDLLRWLIESKKVSKGYVISHLKHMIAINGKKESNYIALKKWKSDLDFVLKL